MSALRKLLVTLAATLLLAAPAVAWGSAPAMAKPSSPNPACGGCW